VNHTKWFLVRHGQTEWNNTGRAQGQADTPLNAKGHAQAALAATRLAPVRFDAAYSSDLSRVVDTANHIMQGRDIPLTKLEALREKGFGEWEGMTFKQVEERYPTMFRRLFDEDVDFAPKDGESDRQLYARVKACADELRRRHAADGRVLVVAHGGSLRAFIAALMRMPPEYMWRFQFENCGISIVSTFDNGARLDLHNDTRHMGDVFEAQN